MLKRLKEIFSKDRYFYGVLIGLVILLGQLPIILHYFHTPKDYYYPLLDRPSFSDYYYLGLIRYGMGPEWFLKIPYVASPHQASAIQVFFVWLGKISLVTGIGPAEVFAIFRVLGGVIFIGAAIVFFRIILGKDKARWAFLFLLLAQPWPYIKKASFLWQDFDVWMWHFGEAARRISAVPPHYTFGKGLMILSLVLLIHYLKKRPAIHSSTIGGPAIRDRAPAVTIPDRLLVAGYLAERVFSANFGGVLAALLIFLAGMIYPPPVFILLFSMTIASAFYIFARGPLAVLQGVPFKKLMGISVYLLASILPLIILQLELAKGPPWSGWNRVELGWNEPGMHFEWEYLQMLGVLVFFVPVMIIVWLRRRIGHLSRLSNLSYLRVFIFIWAISAFFLFPFANLLHLGKFRLTEGAQIVPLAVLACWGWENLRKTIRFKLFKPIFLFCFFSYFFLFSLFQVIWSTKRLWGYWTNVYIKPEEQQALLFLNNQVKADSLVLATTYASNYIPTFARVRTIIGFPDAYADAFEFKREEVIINQILKRELPESKVAEYLEGKKVDYIYHLTYADGEKALYPQLLKSVYKNKAVEIFKVEEIK